jgi:hypothetical protein
VLLELAAAHVDPRAFQDLLKSSLLLAAGTSLTVQVHWPSEKVSLASVLWVWQKTDEAEEVCHYL